MKIANRTIWMYWHQGFDRAPPIVQAARNSWDNLNPDWQIIALDQHSLADWIDLEKVIDVNRPDLNLQKISNIIRLSLLRQYGGVWADATVFCCKSLDHWLPNFYSSGFFAFRNPGPDRLISTWFIAAERDNLLLVALHDAYIDLWRSKKFTNQHTKFGQRVISNLSPLLNRDIKRTLWWTSPVLLYAFRVYPYFIFHYTFNRLILTNKTIRRVWGEASSLDADLPHRLQSLAHLEDGLVHFHNEFEENRWTVQKLDWRADETSPFWSAVLAALIDRSSSVSLS